MQTTDLEQRYIEARASVVDDFSLYLVGMDDQDTHEFLVYWNGALERDIHMQPPTAKSSFIHAIIDQTMHRVREIELGAGLTSSMLN